MTVSISYLLEPKDIQKFEHYASELEDGFPFAWYGLQPTLCFMLNDVDCGNYYQSDFKTPIVEFILALKNILYQINQVKQSFCVILSVVDYCISPAS
ncbi:MAG: hypothetical protein IPJ49_11915 [Candidatus Obscuribacter sp.]|nr:hypothetical protein [Candidatus Obscuribacter sp.]